MNHKPPSKQEEPSSTNQLFLSRFVMNPDELRYHLALCSGPVPPTPRASTSTEQDDDVPATTPAEATTPKRQAHLLNLPVEILTKVLEPLLLHLRTVSLPTFNLNECFDLRPQNPSLFPSVLSTCRLLHAIGTPILYGRNIFDLRAHSRLSIVSPTRGFTMIEPNTMRLVSQLEVEIELTIDRRMPPIVGVSSASLDDAVRHYPGNFQDVQAIRCVLDISPLAQADAMSLLGKRPWVDSSSSTPNSSRFWADLRATLFKWYALLIAGNLRGRYSGFTWMFRVCWEQHGEIKKGIWICRNGKELWPAYRANAMRGVCFKAELEVDSERGTVKEIDGERAGYCF